MAREILEMRNKEMILTRIHEIGISLSHEVTNLMKYRNSLFSK